MFVMQPHQAAPVAAWQGQVKTALSIAWQQTWGDQPVLTAPAEVVSGVAEFYNQSSLALADLLEDSDADADLSLLAQNTYLQLQVAIQRVSPHTAKAPVQTALAPGEFMTQPPLYDILPSARPAAAATAAVAGLSLPSAQPVNLNNPWFTAQDAVTGQKYCLAIYNGEVNKYIGACKNDYY